MTAVKTSHNPDTTLGLVESGKNFAVVNSNNVVIGNRESHYDSLKPGSYTLIEHQRSKGQYLRRIEIVKEK
jgi:hypothetical protein